MEAVGARDHVALEHLRVALGVGEPDPRGVAVDVLRDDVGDLEQQRRAAVQLRGDEVLDHLGLPVDPHRAPAEVDEVELVPGAGVLQVDAVVLQALAAQPVADARRRSACRPSAARGCRRGCGAPRSPATGSPARPSRCPAARAAATGAGPAGPPPMIPTWVRTPGESAARPAAAANPRLPLSGKPAVRPTSRPIPRAATSSTGTSRARSRRWLGTTMPRAPTTTGRAAAQTP